MIIANETSVGFQVTPDLSTSTQENDDLFQKTLAEETNSTNSTIFSDEKGMFLDYPHYDCGEFPDSSFFEEMFQENDFSLTDDHVLTMIKRDGTVTGYYSPNGYTVQFEYSADSTAENPIMNVRFVYHDSQEAWEGTMNLNEIEPSNASKIEMAVLATHLTGNPTSFLTNTMGFDQPTDSMDWTSILAEAMASASGNEISMEQFEDFMVKLETFSSEKDNSSTEDYQNAQLERQLLAEQELRNLRFNFA